VFLNNPCCHGTFPQIGVSWILTCCVRRLRRRSCVAYWSLTLPSRKFPPQKATSTSLLPPSTFPPSRSSPPIFTPRADPSNHRVVVASRSTIRRLVHFEKAPRIVPRPSCNPAVCLVRPQETSKMLPCRLQKLGSRQLRSLHPNTLRNIIRMQTLVENFLAFIFPH
jgi:hypothetical protein